MSASQVWVHNFICVARSRREVAGPRAGRKDLSSSAEPWRTLEPEGDQKGGGEGEKMRRGMAAEGLIYAQRPGPRSRLP